MVIYELVGGDENHQTYQWFSIEALDRQYHFLRSVVHAACELGRPVLSHEVIKCLNHHAIAGLHAYAGEYRPCGVTVGPYTPPAEHRVPALMNMFIDEVNRNWEQADAVSLATHVLWKLNAIHPFVNGNGRTARAAAYYVLCVKAGGWVGGDPILPEALKKNRDEYVQALKAADAGDARALYELLVRLLNGQQPADPTA